MVMVMHMVKGKMEELWNKDLFKSIQGSKVR